MAKVLYKQGTKATYLSLESHLETALYFCTDTMELFKGDDLYTDGLRVVATFDALPDFNKAAESKLYFCTDTKNGYVLNETRDGWNQVLYGIDNETISINDSGLMTVNKIPISAVQGLEARLDEISQDAGVAPPVATHTTAGLVKPGDEFDIAEDGTLSLQAIPIEKVSDLAERLSNIESAQVGGVHYKGSVTTFENLPTDPEQGDLYEIEEDNSEWCWNGEKWFEYGKTVALSPIATSTPDEDQFEIDTEKILRLIGVDSDIVTHRGDSLREILDSLTMSCVWEDMGVSVNPNEASVVSVFEAATDGDTISIQNGSVDIATTITKSATICGATAGLHQNFAQEVK